MKKSELKQIIKESKSFIKNNEDFDGTLVIIEKDGSHKVLNQEAINESINANEIEIAIYYNGFARGIYLKNGLSSMRWAKKMNLV